jgi:hypothetical protein
MEKYNQIQEEIRNLQHQGKYLEKKIEYRKLERLSDQKNIWRKIWNTVSWKNCQYRKKLIHKRKSTVYRVP